MVDSRLLDAAIGLAGIGVLAVLADGTGGSASSSASIAATLLGGVLVVVDHHLEGPARIAGPALVVAFVAYVITMPVSTAIRLGIALGVGGFVTAAGWLALERTSVVRPG